MDDGNPSADVAIRHAQGSDADLLVRWITEVARESEDRELDPRVVATGVATALTDPQHRQYYIAEYKGECVGSLLVTTEWSDWSATWYWWLQSIYIEPDHRGDDPDILGAMVAYIQQEAKAQGVRSVSLYVHERNLRAIRAYEKRGYKKRPYIIYEQPAALLQG